MDGILCLFQLVLAFAKAGLLFLLLFPVCLSGRGRKWSCLRSACPWQGGGIDGSVCGEGYGTGHRAFGASLKRETAGILLSGSARTCIFCSAISGAAGEKLFHGVALFQVIVIISNVVDKGVMGQVQDSGGGPVDEIAVVRHVEDSSRVVVQGIFQNFLGGNIQVVGGLIQDQKIGLREHEFSQGYPSLLAAAQISDEFEHVFSCEEKGS